MSIEGNHDVEFSEGQFETVGMRPSTNEPFPQLDVQMTIIIPRSRLVHR